MWNILFEVFFRGVLPLILGICAGAYVNRLVQGIQKDLDNLRKKEKKK